MLRILKKKRKERNMGKGKNRVKVISEEEYREYLEMLRRKEEDR